MQKASPTSAPAESATRAEAEADDAERLPDTEAQNTAGGTEAPAEGDSEKSQPCREAASPTQGLVVKDVLSQDVAQMLYEIVERAASLVESASHVVEQQQCEESEAVDINDLAMASSLPASQVPFAGSDQQAYYLDDAQAGREKVQNAGGANFGNSDSESQKDSKPATRKLLSHPVEWLSVGQCDLHWMCPSG